MLLMGNNWHMFCKIYNEICQLIKKSQKNIALFKIQKKLIIFLSQNYVSNKTFTKKFSFKIKKLKLNKNNHLTLI